MKSALILAAALVLGFAAGYLVRDRAQPVGRYAFHIANDSATTPLRLDTVTGEMVVCIPTRFPRIDPEAYGVTPGTVGK